MVHHFDEIMASIQKRKKHGRVSYRTLVRVKGCPVKSATFKKSSEAIKWGQEMEAEFRLNRHFDFTPENINRTFDYVIFPHPPSLNVDKYCKGAILIMEH